MSLLFSLIAHLLVTLARLAKPGGLGAVVAESLAVKHQLLILRRARPYLTSWDRLALGVCTLLVSPKRPFLRNNRPAVQFVPDLTDGFQLNALEAVDGKAKSFEEIGSIDAAGIIIERVELSRDGMKITLNLRALLPTEPISGGRS